MSSRRDFVKQTGIAAAGLLGPQLPSNAFASSGHSKFEELRQAVASYAKLLKIPGLAAAVVKDGQVSFVQTEGFADLEKKTPVRRDHIFPVASLTKTFAAVTLTLYEQQGKISMDDYVLDYPFLPVGFTPDRLQSPNVKIKHVLSHTSEGEPGSNYLYNGNRYSFVYGVFEKMSGNTKHYEAFADEVSKQVLRPLNMNSTLPGYPSNKNHPAIPRIVSTYLWEREGQSFKRDKSVPEATTLFPSTNLFTTIDDLAAYSIALDRHTLLTEDSYRKMTTPFVTNSGRTNPYGLGWSTQEVAGRPVHWHYGYGDSYGALIVRVPQEKLSFILLTNSGGASAPFLLGYGNLLNSVFAHAFFKYVVLGRKGQFSYEKAVSGSVAGADAFSNDEIFSQALMRQYAAQNYNGNKGEASALMRSLALHDPGRFQKVDISLISLLAELKDPTLKTQMEGAIQAYAGSGWFHPPIHGQIAGWYEETGNPQAARLWFHKLADSTGYGEQGDVRQAGNVLGKYYLDHGEKEKGRNYLWRNALLKPDDAPQQIIAMKSV